MVVIYVLGLFRTHLHSDIIQLSHYSYEHHVQTCGTISHLRLDIDGNQRTDKLNDASTKRLGKTIVAPTLETNQPTDQRNKQNEFCTRTCDISTNRQTDEQTNK